MAWSYEIAHRDPLNKRWYALCELATQLRERIIDTDGDDTNAPTYTKADETTSKQIAIADFVGEALRSELLQYNVGVFRAAIMEKNTEFGSHWCNSGGTTRYTSVSELLSAGSYGSSWISDDEDWTPDYWAQMYEAMENLRYIFWNLKRNTGTGYGSATAKEGRGESGYETTQATAYSNAEADYGETTEDYSSSTAWVRLLVQADIALGSPNTYKLTFISVAENACDALSDFYSNLAGTITDSGWAIRASVITPEGTLEHSSIDVVLTTDYDTHNISGDSTVAESVSYLFNGNLAGAEIDLGTYDLTPMPPSTSEVDPFWTVNGPGLFVTAQPDITEGGFSGQTITKNNFNYYLTDLGHPSNL